ncbi:MAG TPA: abortive infection family protein [Candidatus Didemnitutus sp.]|jgi:hypothetical protein
MPVSEITRHLILDYLRGESAVYHGKMDEIEFLGRLFDLTKIKSDDPRSKTFRGDISTHRYQFQDWENSWIYTDDRFALARADDGLFLRFLCQMLHPLTLRPRTEAARLLGEFNKYLAADGWQIARGGEISGKPYYEPAVYSRGRVGALGKVKRLPVALTSLQLARQIKRLESSVDSDPELAIGTAKELLETVCRTILGERGQPVTGAPDIPTLNRLTLKELDLLPDHAHAHSKGTEVMSRLLSNLGSITHGVAEIRGLYGTGHGKDGNNPSLDARHARLAIGAAATMATFLYETHLANRAALPRP